MHEISMSLPLPHPRANGTARPLRANRFFRPRLELLESRVAPTVDVASVRSVDKVDGLADVGAIQRPDAQFSNLAAPDQPEAARSVASRELLIENNPGSSG